MRIFLDTENSIKSWIIDENIPTYWEQNQELNNWLEYPYLLRTVSRAELLINFLIHLNIHKPTLSSDTDVLPSLLQVCLD